MEYRRKSARDLIASVRPGLIQGMRRRFGELAVERGLVTAGQVDEAMSGAPGRLGEALVARGWLKEDDVEALLAEQRRRELVEYLKTRAEQMPEAAAAAAADPSRRLDRYVLTETIGSGGMAQIWKAWDAALSRWVAVKVLNNEARNLNTARRFVREAAVAGGLRHPNIVGVHDSGLWGDRPYLVMDLIEGGDLESWVIRRQPPAYRVAEVMETVARAMHEAHAKGIVHRDLKPSNILMTEQESPVVVDFGLARAVDESQKLTATGTTLGTPYYMAPEQIAASGRPLDGRCDVYAMGVVLYQMLTGTLPFVGATVAETFQKITGEVPPEAPRKLRPTIPRELETICLTAMAREIEARYATSLELASDLLAFRSGQPIRARRRSLAGRAFGWARRRPMRTAALVLIAASAIGTAAWVWTSQVRQARRLAAMRDARRAAAAYRAGRFDEARAAASSAVATDATLAEGHFWLGRTHLRAYLEGQSMPMPWKWKGDLEFSVPPAADPAERERAERAFAGIRRDAFQEAEGWEWPCATGLLALARGDYRAAASSLAEARTAGRDADVEIDYLHGLALYYSKDFAGALAAFDAQFEPRAIVAKARAAHGLALEAESRGADPEPLYAKALEIGERRPSILLTRAIYRIDAGQMAKAGLDLTEVLLQAAGSDEESAWVEGVARGEAARLAYALGNFDASERRVEEALEGLAKASASHPASAALALAHVTVMKDRAVRRAAMGRRAEAARDAEAATARLDEVERRFGPQVEGVLARADLVSVKWGRGPESKEVGRMLEEAARRWPSISRVRIRRAEELLNVARWEVRHGRPAEPHLGRALETCDEVLAKFPSQTYGLATRARSLIYQAEHAVDSGRAAAEALERAGRDIDRLSALAPVDVNSLTLRGQLLMARAFAPACPGNDAREHEQRAIDLLEGARRSHGRVVAVLEMLGDIYYRVMSRRSAAGEDVSSLLPPMQNVSEEAKTLDPASDFARLLSIHVRLTRAMAMSGTDVAGFRTMVGEALGDVEAMVGEDPEDLIARELRVTALQYAAIAAGLETQKGQALLDRAMEDVEWSRGREPKRAWGRRQALVTRAWKATGRIGAGDDAETTAGELLADLRLYARESPGDLGVLVHCGRLGVEILRRRAILEPDARPPTKELFEDLNTAVSAAPWNSLMRLQRAEAYELETLIAQRLGAPKEEVVKLATAAIDDAKEAGELNAINLPMAKVICGRTRVARALTEDPPPQAELVAARDEFREAFKREPRYEREVQDYLEIIRRFVKDDF